MIEAVLVAKCVRVMMRQFWLLSGVNDQQVSIRPGLLHSLHDS